MRHKINIEPGMRFGALVAEASAGYPASGRKAQRWDCRCDCGKQVPAVYAYNLGNGNSRSCGHDRRSHLLASVVTHRKSKSRIYGVYHQILQRCYSEKHKTFHRYGGRGVVVCDRWLGEGGFERFDADMGPRPTADHTVERKNNDLGYSPENCTWATKKEQARNRVTSLKFNVGGEMLCLSEICDKYDRPYSTMWFRVKTGWTIESAISTPIRRVGGREKNVAK